jgi:hypothetical protein
MNMVFPLYHRKYCNAYVLQKQENVPVPVMFCPVHLFLVANMW